MPRLNKFLSAYICQPSPDQVQAPISTQWNWIRATKWQHSGCIVSLQLRIILLKISKTILDKAVLTNLSSFSQIGHHSWRGRYIKRTLPKGLWAGEGLPWCVVELWQQLRPAGASCGLSLPCPWSLCVCRIRLSAAPSAPRRSWPHVVCRMDVRRQWRSLAVGAVPPVHCPKGRIVASTHPGVALGSGVTRPEVWSGRCTYWCTGRASALTRGRRRTTQHWSGRMRLSPIIPTTVISAAAHKTSAAYRKPWPDTRLNPQTRGTWAERRPRQHWLHVVLNCRGLWTDWAPTLGHTTISSRSPSPTVTRTETSTSNSATLLVMASVASAGAWTQRQAWDCLGPWSSVETWTATSSCRLHWGTEVVEMLGCFFFFKCRTSWNLLVLYSRCTHGQGLRPKAWLQSRLKLLDLTQQQQKTLSCVLLLFFQMWEFFWALVEYCVGEFENVF